MTRTLKNQTNKQTKKGTSEQLYSGVSVSFVFHRLHISQYHIQYIGERERGGRERGREEERREGERRRRGRERRRRREGRERREGRGERDET